MMGTIDRIRYYDGEYLRAFDLSDEQTYHMEMRRRINRYLHQYGIAQGLTLSGVTQAGVTQVSILPGMAIDAYGREIYVFAPYTLGNNDITANRISQAGTYDVWLRYRKMPGTPPSSGYGNCNQANQYTRWVESFSVALLPSPSNPFTLPGFADSDGDDPSQDQVGVLLGTVYADPTSATGTFSSPLFDPKRCVLLGVIAQSIQVPPSWDAAQAFSFVNASGVPNSPMSPPASLEIVPNVFADQNLIVGADFVLTPAAPANVQFVPPITGSPSGNMKVAGDLFVQGNVYTLITSTTQPPPAPPTLPPPAGNEVWLGIGSNIKQIVQQSMPDFVASPPFPVMVPKATSSTSFMATAPTIIIPSKISAMSAVVASVAISGIQLNAPITFGSSVGVYINNVSPLPGANQCTVSVTYTVTGDFMAGDPPSILSFYLTATAVCFP
jgi:hypothetical protein